MTNKNLAVLLAALAGAYFFLVPQQAPEMKKPDQDQKRPLMPWIPVPEPKPKPLRPWLSDSLAPVGAPVRSGKVGPDGRTEITCDLPQSEKKRNIGGRDGSGLCVFSSCEWAGRYQNDRDLFNFQTQMKSELGGGWPEKVDQMLKKYCPNVRYVQNTNGDLEILKAAIRSNRMPCITYCGKDLHYGGRSVAHMVNLVHIDDQWAAISDNNFVEDSEILWMSIEDFKDRFNGGGGGWSIVFLQAGPPPPPRN